MLAARRQARIAQGRDPDQRDLLAAQLRPRTRAPTVIPPIAPTPRPSEAIGVLSLGEAAARLVVIRSALEAMIDAGKIEALPTGRTRMVPTTQVDRLTNSRAAPNL